MGSSELPSGNNKINSAVKTTSSGNTRGGGGGSWIGTVCETLHTMPLITILNRMQYVPQSSSFTSTYDSYHNLKADTTVLVKNTDQDDNSMEIDEEYEQNQDPLDIYSIPTGEGGDIDIEKMRENEQNFALAGGVKRLEYRLSAVLRGLRERDFNGLKELQKITAHEEAKITLKGLNKSYTSTSTTASTSISFPNIINNTKSIQSVSSSAVKISKEKSKIENNCNNIMKIAFLGMETVIKVITTTQAISALTDAININNMDNISAVFAVITSYSKILMSSPCGAEIAQDSNPLSIRILNSMAFSRPKDPLTKRLWGLLNMFDQTIVSDAINRGYGSTSTSSSSSSSNFISSSRVHNNLTNLGGISSICSINNGSSNYVIPYSALTIQIAVQLSLSPSLLCEGLQSTLYLLCSVLSHQLTATDDEEFFDDQNNNNDNNIVGEKVDNNLHRTNPITSTAVPNLGTGLIGGKCPSLKDIKLLVPILKSALYRLYWSNPLVDTFVSSSSGIGSSSITGCSSLEDLQVICDYRIYF